MRTLLLLAALAFPAHAAGPVTFSVCPGQTPTFKACGPASPKCMQPMYELRITCPGAPAPVMTVLGCMGPKVAKTGDNYTASCTAWQPLKTVLP